MQNFRFPLTSLLCFAAITFLTAQNIPRANFSGPMDAEVNTYNGNLYLERTDVSLPNQDLPLAISFSFNSFRDSTDAGYGYGWSHNYGLRCEEIAGAVVVQRAHGRRDTFTVGNEQFQAPPGIFDVLTSTGPGNYVLTAKEGMTYTFNEAAHGYVTSINNTNGRSLSMSYVDSLLTGVSDAGGRSLVLAYQGGRLTGLTDSNFPGGRSWRYAYTPGGQLAAVTSPLEYTVNYTYDGTGRLTGYTDERGSGLEIAYEEAGRVTYLRTCITRVDFAYNEAQGRTIISEQNEGTDQLTTHVYDREGRLVRKTGNCCGYDQAYNYDGNNNLADMTDANGNTVSGQYDDFGNTVATRDALSEQQTFTFGDLNRMTGFTDKRGNTTSMTYNGRGNLTRVSQPEGSTLNMQYDGRGNLSQLANGKGNVSRMSYNANNDLTEVNYPIGRETFGYDGAGNMTITTDANDNPSYFRYDALSRLVSIKDAEGDSIRYHYDEASNLTLEIDGKGNRKKFSYDAHNRLIAVETEIGITRYGYDQLNNLTSITNAAGKTSKFAYDTRSRLTMEVDAMGFATHYEYDANGNVVSRIDANLQETLYTYDANDRLISKAYAGNTDNYSYDPDGNLIRASNNDITYEFNYDGLNRMTRKYVVEWDMAIEYTYDANGNRTQMKDPDGGITRYIYDTNDRLILLINPFGETFRFAYDAGGRLLRQDNFNRTYATYAYDKANRLTELRNLKSDGTLISSYAYEYDANGLRTSMTDTEGTHEYTYDAENRLTGVTYADGTVETYEFDDAGNRTRLVRDGVETLYTYDAADRIISAGNINFEFDGNGNMIRKAEGDEVTTYRWDGENRLLGVEAENVNASFAYDAFGKRINNFYNGDKLNFFSDNDHDFYVFNDDQSEKKRYTSGLLYDEWLSVRISGSSYSFGKDELGSVKQILNASGLLVRSSNYKAFGNLGSTSGTFEQTISFTGRENVVGGNLLYFRTRFYDPAIGRFMNKDLFDGFTDRPASINKFSYLENDPINYTDPTGEFLPILGVIVFHGVRAIATHVVKKIIVKKITKKAVKSFAGNAALGLADQTLVQGKKLKCVDWFDVAVDGVMGYSPLPMLGKGTFKALGKTTRTHAERQVLASQWRRMQRTGAKRGSFKNIDEYNAIVNDVQKANRMIARRDLAGVAIRSAKKKRLKDDVDISACGNEGTGTQSPENPRTPGPGQPPGPDGKPRPDICIPIIQPIDPNEIIGPEGIGPEKWVKGDATLPYTILYENDPEFATAAAQRVFLTHPFDDSVNPFSFRIGSFGFGSFFFEVPEGLSYYNTQLDLRDSLGVYLNVVAGIDIELNQAFWVFESVDPSTGFTATLPAEVGFLPVNDTITRNGEGFVNFTIRPSAAAELGDRIEARASIIFDDQDAIETNVEINTIDPERPVSGVSNIDTLGDGEYRLDWSATELGAGLAETTLFVAADDGGFLPTSTFTNTSGSYVFNGEAGSTYQFFTIARDSVGNVERMKAVGEPACMTVSVVSQTAASAGNNNGSVELNVTGGRGELTFAWEHEPGLNGPVAANLAPGLYRVAVTDVRGCTVEAVVDIALLNATPAPAAAPQIVKIYPVPSRDDITMEFYAPDALLSAVIYDANGRAAMRQTVNALPQTMNTQHFNVSNLPAGTYFLRLESRRGTYSVGTFFKQ